MRDLRVYLSSPVTDYLTLAERPARAETVYFRWLLAEVARREAAGITEVTERLEASDAFTRLRLEQSRAKREARRRRRAHRALQRVELLGEKATSGVLEASARREEASFGSSQLRLSPSADSHEEATFTEAAAGALLTRDVPMWLT